LIAASGPDEALGTRWDDLNKWSGAATPGHLTLDLAGGIDDQEWDARLRARYGINTWLSAGAEAYAEHRWGSDTHYGVMAGITATF
jgi:hypothetical protein